MNRLPIALIFLVLSPAAPAQLCRLSVAGLNQSRRVVGTVHAECPEEIIHSAPFGNWGATSNFGQKGDSHQFDGWCHNTRVCDNNNQCKTDCLDGWYEWNTCTDNSLFRAPNCSLYNSASCTEQVTATGINVHGTKLVDVPVSCPTDTNGDGVPDKGGCLDAAQYSSGTNFISLYELDPVCCDELVQTIYFPTVNLTLPCDSLGCAPVASPWLDPTFWDSPATPAKIFAQMAVLVNWGTFVDSGNRCKLPAASANAVSAASFVGPALAPESIGTVFGSQLAPATEQASTVPLPTSLAGVSVTVTDRAGVNRAAPLFYASPTQINFQVPVGTAAGPATVTVQTNGVTRAIAKAQVEPTAPAIFTQNSDGRGVPAALLVRIAPDGTTRSDPVFSCGATPGSCQPLPLDLGPAEDRIYLLLFGTGIRNRTSLTGVSITVGGMNFPIDYAGPQGQFVGLDQVNVPLSHALAGRGAVDIVLAVDSKPGNTVQLVFR